MTNEIPILGAFSATFKIMHTSTDNANRSLLREAVP